VHFDNEALRLEALLPGLKALGSAFGAVRDEDGLCGVHARYVRADSACAAHQALPAPTPAPARDVAGHRAPAQASGRRACS